MKYFILQNGEQTGPYHESRVRHLLAEGRISGDLLAWREGLAEWVPLSTLIFVASPREVAPVAPAAPPVWGSPAARPASEPMGFGTKVAIAIGAVGALLITALLVVTFNGLFKVEKSAQAYVDTYVAHIAPAWSSDELMNRVNSTYRDQFDPKTMQAMFKKLSGLGNLKHANPSVALNATTTPNSAVVNVQDAAIFDNGDATFTIYLVQVDGQWTIAGFHVESPIFFK